jgi:hypothetical protein
LDTPVPESGMSALSFDLALACLGVLVFGLTQGITLAGSSPALKTFGRRERHFLAQVGGALLG